MIDINKLGKEYEIYTTISYIGKGFPIILPRGARIIKILRNYVEQEEEKQGYKVVRTPSMSNSEIYKIEDRYDNEKDRLFVIKNSDEEKNSIVLKPNIQPFHCSIFKENQHSYKELPIKYCETSTVFRNETDIKGIMKTRQITLSDASVFCEPRKIEKEIKKIIELQQMYIKKLDLDVTYEISTWNEKEKENYIGTIDEWNNVVQAMKNVLDSLKIEYKTENKARMYGPSIILKYNGKKFLNIQIDFEITHRFDIKYTDSDNTEKFPIYIHHTVVGSYEKLLAMLIERYQGEFPLWLTPEQVVIISKGEEYDDYSKKVKNKIEESGIRVELDNSAEGYQNKIKKQQKLKIPYIVTIGKDELSKNKINVIQKEKNNKYSIDELIKEVKECQKQF